MDTVLEFYNAVRTQFPQVTVRADAEHIKHWGELDPEFAYSWFQSLAHALNRDMERGIDIQTHVDLFLFINSALATSRQEVANCIDVSFVENLFWRLPEEKARPYWLRLPQPLKDL
jgi:hypothetical protein